MLTILACTLNFLLFLVDSACFICLNRFSYLLLACISRDKHIFTLLYVPGEAPVVSEHALVESVGVVLFQALDYGLSEEEEHQLSPPLEALIDRMTGGGGSLSRKSTESSAAVEDAPEPEAEPDDEGIEELADEEEQENMNRLSMQDVLTVSTCSVSISRSMFVHLKYEERLKRMHLPSI